MTDPKPTFHAKYYEGPGWSRKKKQDWDQHIKTVAAWRSRRAHAKAKPTRKAASRRAYENAKRITDAWDAQERGKKKRDAARLRWLKKKDAAARLRYSWKK